MLTLLIHIPRNSLSRYHIILSQKFHSNQIDNKESNSKNDDKKFKLPEEPQNCCMSGCANCVWIDYAEKVAEIFQDGGETAKEKIMEHVKDPNLRAFLMLELDHLFKKKK